MDDLFGSFGGVEPTPAYEKRQSKLLQRSSAPVGGGSMLDDLMGGGPSAPAPGATVVKPSGGSLMDAISSVREQAAALRAMSVSLH